MNDNPKYKAIETIHSGYRFRSRLEARWAVFFETLGIEYRYEPEGFELPDGTWYLPDFYLPKMDCWIEIKGQDPTEEELLKAYKLTQETEKPTFVFGGDCWHATNAYAFTLADFTRYPFKLSLSLAMDYKEDCHLISKDLGPIHGVWLSDDEYRGYIADRNDPFACSRRTGFHLKDHIYWEYPKQWVECPVCKRLWIDYASDSTCNCSRIPGTYNPQSSRLIAAFEAARQARF